MKVLHDHLTKSEHDIASLREGYRIVTGLDNCDEFGDDEMFEYMQGVLEHGEPNTTTIKEKNDE